MARRTKAQIELERKIHRMWGKALLDKSINVMSLGKVEDAIKNALAAGKSDEDAQKAGDDMAESLNEKVA